MHIVRKHNTFCHFYLLIHCNFVVPNIPHNSFLEKYYYLLENGHLLKRTLIQKNSENNYKHGLDI